MIIESVRVKNFRSILDEHLACDELTALVGPNGCGKSSFLRALELFYTSSPRIDVEDFYNCNTAVEIAIGITFTSLSKEAAELFSSYMQGETLTVERVLTLNAGRVAASYHGASLQNLEFQPIRDGLSVRDRGKIARTEYDEARKRPGDRKST